MTSDACRELRPLLGVAALGGLEPAEEIALRAHLDGCPECRAELRELTSVARALPLADVTRLRDREEPSDVLGEHVLDRVAHERSVVRARRRRRRVSIAIAATVAAAAIVIGVLVFAPSGSDDSHVAFPTTNGVRANATLKARAAGTEIDFHVQGLHRGEYYWLWLTGDDGDRIAAGTFQGTLHASELVMTAAIPRDEARRIWVTDEHNRIILDQILPRATSL